MNQVSEQEIRRYFWQVRHLLPVHKKEEKQFLNTFQSEVYAFIKEHPNSSLDDIVDQFHSPQRVVYDYLLSLDHKRLCSLLSLRRHMKRTIGLLLMLAVLAWGCYMTLNQVANYIFENQPSIEIWRVAPAEEEDYE